MCIHLCYEYSVVFPTSQTFLPTSAQICVYFWYDTQIFIEPFAGAGVAEAVPSAQPEHLAACWQGKTRSFHFSLSTAMSRKQYCQSVFSNGITLVQETALKITAN